MTDDENTTDTITTTEQVDETVGEENPCTYAIPTGSTEAGIPYTSLRTIYNQRKTRSLFLENNYTRERTDPAPFTLQPFDYKGKTSLKRLYMECADPTEYTFAIKALGCWQHWQLLAGSTFFLPHIEEWRNELEVMLRAEAIRQVRDDAADGRAQSAKWIAEKGWQKTGGKRGRPTKKEVAAERKRLAQLDAGLSDDASRVFDNGDNLH